jgi:hypothetical protein
MFRAPPRTRPRNSPSRASVKGNLPSGSYFCGRRALLPARSPVCSAHLLGSSVGDREARAIVSRRADRPRRGRRAGLQAPLRRAAWASAGAIRPVPVGSHVGVELATIDAHVQRKRQPTSNVDSITVLRAGPGRLSGPAAVDHSIPPRLLSTQVREVLYSGPQTVLPPSVLSGGCR